jgi:hypothetical protein
VWGQIHYPHLPKEYADTMASIIATTTVRINGTSYTYNTEPHAHNHPELSGRAQLLSYPLARYYRDNELMPNVPLIGHDVDVNTQGYLMHEGEHALICLELAKRWNYYMPVSHNTKVGLEDVTLPLLDAANQHPELPRFAMSFWAQISPGREFPTATNNLPPSGREPVPNFPKTCLSINTTIVQCDGQKPEYHVTHNEEDCYYDDINDAQKQTMPCDNPKIQSNWLANCYYLYKDSLVNDGITHTTDPRTGFWYKMNRGDIFRDSGNNIDNFYFREDKAQDPFCLNRNGYYKYAHKLLSPISPLYAFEKDAELHHYYISLLVDNNLNPTHSLMPRPNGNTIDMIVENGEVETMIPVNDYNYMTNGNNNPFSSSLRHLYAFTPSVRSAYASYNPTDLNMTDVQSMHNFQTQGMANRYDAYLRTTQADAINLGLQNTLYTLYSMDGQRLYRYEWDVIRRHTSKIRGMRYATPDYYPFKVWWKKGCCGSEGLDRIVESRNEEMRNNPDKLFSPYVTAGWNPD